MDCGLTGLGYNLKYLKINIVPIGTKYVIVHHYQMSRFFMVINSLETLFLSL